MKKAPDFAPLIQMETQLILKILLGKVTDRFLSGDETMVCTNSFVLIVVV